MAYAVACIEGQIGQISRVVPEQLRELRPQIVFAKFDFTMYEEYSYQIVTAGAERTWGRKR